MNDMEFIKTLKEKRNAYGYSQTRLAQKKMNPKICNTSLTFKYHNHAGFVHSCF